MFIDHEIESTMVDSDIEEYDMGDCSEDSDDDTVSITFLYDSDGDISKDEFFTTTVVSDEFVCDERTDFFSTYRDYIFFNPFFGDNYFCLLQSPLTKVYDRTRSGKQKRKLKRQTLT